MPGPVDYSNFAKSGIDTAGPTGMNVLQPVVSGAVESVAGVPITNPYGLRRWRAAFADALNAEAPIVCVGDSHTFGQNANGSNTSTAADNVTDAVLGWPGQLRKLLAMTYGDPGEGFIFPSQTQDSRVTIAGGGVFLAPGQAQSIMIHNMGLVGLAQTITVTVPTGATRMLVVQANVSGGNSGSWQIGGVAQGNISTLTGTGVPITTYLPVAAGNVITLLGPSSGRDTFLAVGFRTAQTTGVPVHRIGVGGQTQSLMLGGGFNGVLGTNDGTNFYSTAAQQANVSACYKWAGAKGLVVVYFGTNEQALQQGAAGLNNGMTPALFTQGVQLAVNQIAADGWCSLLVGPPPSGSELQAAGAHLLPDYTAQLQSIAASTDHCAMIDIADLWGPDTAAAKLATSNAGLRDAGSSHPTRAGYGDIARHVLRVLDTVLPVGN